MSVNQRDWCWRVTRACVRCGATPGQLCQKLQPYPAVKSRLYTGKLNTVTLKAVSGLGSGYYDTDGNSEPPDYSDLLKGLP